MLIQFPEKFGFSSKKTSIEQSLSVLKEYNMIKKTLWNCSNDGFIDCLKMKYYLNQMIDKHAYPSIIGRVYA